MAKRIRWWETRMGQVVLALAFAGAALILVPPLVDRLPIPTGSVAWAILPWVLILLLWVVIVRQFRARFRSRRPGMYGRQV